MKLMGKKLLLDTPEVKPSAITLDEATKQDLLKDEASKLQKLKVFKVGSDITDIKEGDEVYVVSYALGNPEVIDVEGKLKILVNYVDVVIVW